MQTNNYKIIIPYAPDSINQVVQYGKRNGDVVMLKHKWEKVANFIIDQNVWDGNLPDKFRGRIGFFFKLYFKTERERDGDNYTLMCKGIIDAFVKKGFIKDDNARFVDDDGRRLRIDPEAPRVEIYIKEKIEDDILVKIKPYEQPTCEDTNQHSEEI
jgi:Holliday junction resolvase RusA-like endonuclease